jgi:glycosyltransferase involved in cell wall biosynthesis
MDVLLLYPYLPHPGVAHGSGRLVEPLLRLWRERGVRVTLVCGHRPHERDRVEATRGLVHALYAVETPQRVDRGPLGRLAESARTAVKETLSGRPRFVVKLDRPAVRRAIRAARAATRFDAAQVELAGYASYVDELAGLPTVLVDHEAGTASGDDLATDPRALRFVRELFPRFSRVLALSEEDAADLAAASPGLQVGLRRPGVVPPDPSPYAAAESGRLFFFGSAEHVPNHDAFAWLADEIWPAVRGAHPAATCCVATGRLPAPLQAKLDAAGIRHLGFVKEILDEIRRAAVVVAPLRKGRGVRIKNVEALAAGRPLVTTSLGARGLLLKPDEHAVIADDAPTFVAAVLALLRDPSRAARLAAAGRAHLLAHFTHESAADANVALWRELSR